MDVIVQRDEAKHLDADLLASSCLTQGAISSAASKLSPPEVDGLNKEATEAFLDIAKSGSAAVYCSFLRKLYAEGLISQVGARAPRTLSSISTITA